MRRRFLALSLILLPLVLAGCFADGTHAVGTAADQVAPGRYSTPGGTGCYWARLQDLSGTTAGIIANNIGDGRQFVDVAPTDAGIESEGCGRWVPIPSIVPTFNATPGVAIPDGMGRVGADVLPGTWKTNGPAGTDCYWARVSGFSGEGKDVLANDFAKEPLTVTILPSDVGFISDGCTGWTAVASSPPTTTPTPTPTPAPTTTTVAPSSGDQGLVHGGAFCSPQGATGHTSINTPMVCAPASDGRLRWRTA